MDTEIANLYHHLSNQAQTLLTELEAFKQHIQSHPQGHPQASRPDSGLNLNKFRADVARETKQLEHNASILQSASNNTNTQPPTNGTTIHQIRSSNITHLASIWHEVKRNKGVTGIRKQVRYTLNPSLPPSASAGNSVSKPTPPPTSKWTSTSTSKQNSAARQRSKIYHDRQAEAQRNGIDEFRIPRSDREHVTVDICAVHGAKWIKVFTKNQRWLVMDLAREGLVDLRAESEGEDGDGHVERGHGGDTAHSHADVNGKSIMRREALALELELELEELKLVKMAREFLTAARTTRVGQQHRHPKVYFVLPKIERGVSSDVDAVLQYIEDIGITVTTATADQHEQRDHRPEDPDHDPDHDQPTAPTPDLHLTFRHVLTPPPLTPPSQTLNIDTTLLIALISDISHLSLSTIMIPTHYNGRASKTDILAQMASEDVDPLLPGHIYPVLRGRKLVCTRAAERHLRGIVGVMGSERETARSCVLFGGDGGRDPASVRGEFGRNSVHGVPEDLMLPIEVVEDGSEDLLLVERPSLLDAEVMRRVADQPRLSGLNRRVLCLLSIPVTSAGQV
ncbi:hypothetical protein LTR24_004981 [Lithohypha guttulata]|uniref:Uncharacterized protein n=1 Tax=Lithohypha guttulata TaxID=1690604 RepID=A0ABR0KA73_9EURO|nr:hypothetical protein LTR24_004981 [Lithohypha guttulata]